MGILMEDIKCIKDFKFIYIFHVEIPVFANVSFNMGNPKVNIKTIESKVFDHVLFLNVILKR